MQRKGEKAYSRSIDIYSMILRDYFTLLYSRGPERGTLCYGPLTPRQYCGAASFLCGSGSG
jgi:hypothetical protein